MSDIDLHHLAAVYALDALDPGERSQFEAHYHNCEICHTDVIDFRSTLAGLAAASHERPPAYLRARLMAKVGATRQLSPLLSSRSHPASRRLSSGGWSAGVAGVAAAAALLLAIGSGVLAGRVNDRSYDQTAAELLDQSDTRIIDMPGPNGARVRVAWSPTIAKAVVTGENLPNPGPGKAYELWLIDDNGARPAGLLDRAADGTIHRVIGLPGAAAALGITIEAATGSATPTAPVLFSSSA